MCKVVEQSEAFDFLWFLNLAYYYIYPCLKSVKARQVEKNLCEK